jgi:MinD-like ATPase involved in chromosome partitioning or flagellar assembly
VRRRRRIAFAVKLAVLIAAGGAAWEANLVAWLEREPSPVEVARRCVDVVELVAVASSGQGRAALVAADLRRLDADAIDRLVAAGVAPVGVVARDDEAGEQRLRALGIEHLVPADTEPSVIAGVLVQAAEAQGSPGRSSRGFGDPTSSLAIPPGSAESAPVRQGGMRGSVIAVWGPTGAPGRTTVAVTVADELARLGRASLLVDADVYGGTIAATLGLLDESPGLAAACRLAAGTRLDGVALAGLCWQLRPELRILTGIPLASRWTELRPAAITAVLAAARELAEYTVVDCAFCLETDEELSYDSLAPRRNGATLAVLDDADCVVVVGGADPIGMQRLVRGLRELRDAEVTAPQRVVLNKVRHGVVPGDPRAELTGALASFTGVKPAALLPYDRETLDLALASGRTLGEHRPSGPLRHAIGELAASLAGAPTASGRRRR